MRETTSSERETAREPGATARDCLEEALRAPWPVGAVGGLERLIDWLERRS
jgi:hypothetical protein